jgi:uroporphyrinogen-III synthase
MVARDVIPRELRAAGATVEVVEAYETIVPAASRARLQAVLKNPRLRPSAITFTSSSTAKNFVELLPGRSSCRKLLDGVVLASIGPVTSATLREVGLRADVEATEYTMDGLVSALIKALAHR